MSSHSPLSEGEAAGRQPLLLRLGRQQPLLCLFHIFETDSLSWVVTKPVKPRKSEREGKRLQKCGRMQMKAETKEVEKVERDKSERES